MVNFTETSENMYSLRETEIEHIERESVEQHLERGEEYILNEFRDKLKETKKKVLQGIEIFFDNCEEEIVIPALKEIEDDYKEPDNKTLSKDEIEYYATLAKTSSHETVRDVMRYRNYLKRAEGINEEKKVYVENFFDAEEITEWLSHTIQKRLE